MSACSIIDTATIEVIIRPEDANINPSPWYAVKVSPRGTDTPLSLQIRYEGGKHRYAPKFSSDGKTWSALAPEAVHMSDDGTLATVELPIATEPYFVAGQEVVDNDNYKRWSRTLSTYSPERPISHSTVGNSVEGQAILAYTSRAKLEKRKTVFLVGRQHPPEVTGALAMRSFVDTIYSNSDLAHAFKDKFDVVLVPNMNPDGVEHGHWRHNMNGVDLNRDWGPFTQPETQAVKSMIDRIDADPDNEIVLFLDFHSTRRNVFYTQTKEDEPTAYDFTGQWMTRSRARLPEYEFERAERHNTEKATSKNYMNQRFGIPAITYELGDETDRDQIATSATVFAEEMMQILLANE